MEVITRKLVVLSSVAKGASFLLTGNEVGIGREDDSAICLEDDLVSRHHALLVRKHSEYILRDRNSLNGTFLNGQQVHEAILRVGDRISIGDVELGYESVVVEPSGSSRSQPSKAERVPPEPTTALTSLRIRMPAANKSASEPVVEPEVSRQPQLQLPHDLDEIRQATEQLAALSKENRELTGRLFALEMRTADERQGVESASAEIQRLEAELAHTREAAERMSLLSGYGRETGEVELLEKNKQLIAKLEPIELALEKLRHLVQGDRLEEMKHALDEVARVRAALEAAAALRAPVTRLARENEELRRALGKAHEEIALARRCLSDQTTQEFGRIRKNIMERSATGSHTGLRGPLDAARRALHIQ